MKKWMKNFGYVLCIIIIVFSMSACEKNQLIRMDGKKNQTRRSTNIQEVVIKAQTRGTEMTRVGNLVSAAKRINEQFEKEGKNIRVRVETDAYNGGWETYSEQFIKAFREKREPDIFVTGHEDIGWLAKGNYILPLDELKYSDAYKDVYPTLWEATKWKGHIWGALQDTEARPVFYRKDVLAKLGWSDEEIDNLPKKVQRGEFTIYDMTAVAKQAMDQGIVEWGILHRPKNGPEFHMIAKNFGAMLYDEKQDKIIFDRKDIKKTLAYFEAIAQKENVTMDHITKLEWDDIHQLMLDGKALFYYGGIWNIFNYIELGADYDEIMKKFGFMLVPAAEKGQKPLTMSRPMLYTVSSQTQNKELVVRLLELVAAPEYQAKHAVETCHLPISTRGAQLEEFKNDTFLNSVVYMLDYSVFMPNNENFPQYGNVFFEAIEQVETGECSVEQALEYMEKQLRVVLKDNIIIK